MSTEDAVARLRSASDAWAAALEAHWSAPPAPGFADRLGQLANAAAEQARAFRFAEREGLPWRSLPNASESLEPAPELRPSFNRTGPPGLWDRFDEDLRALGIALEGVSAIQIAHVFEQLGDSLHALADANKAQELPPGVNEARTAAG